MCKKIVLRPFLLNMEAHAEHETSNADWRILRTHKVDFIKILSLLVEYDERTGKAARYPDPQRHRMRQAIAAANPDLSRFLIRRIAANLFSIVAETVCDGGLVTTRWLHEDAINQERSQQEPDHPVHSITCVTDLFENYCEPLGAENDLNSFTHKLMNEVEVVSRV